MGLEDRIRTTTKQLTGEAAPEIKQQFQNAFAGMFGTKHFSLIYHCDETSVNLDAPGNRTMRKGVDIVEIGTSRHDLDRVMISVLNSSLHCLAETR